MLIKPLPRWAQDAIGWLFLPVFGPFVLALVITRMVGEWKEHIFGPFPRVWQRWFAWYLVEIFDWDA